MKAKHFREFAMRFLLALTLALVLAGSAPLLAASINLAPNPSFEQGEAAPAGWIAGPGANWESGGRTGARALAVRSPETTRAWRTELIPLPTGQSVRLDGWLRVRSGRARLGLDLLGAKQDRVASTATPAVGPAARWQYVAVERDLPAGVVSGRIWLEGEGEFRLDDVTLVPMIRNLVMNGDFEVPTTRGIPYWDEAKDNLFPETRAGSQALAPGAGRAGAGLSVQSEPAAWWGARTISLPVVPGITAYRLSVWVRPESGTPAVRALWVEPHGRTLRADAVNSVGGPINGWYLYERRDLQPAAGATAVRVGLAARGGKAFFDDVWLSPTAPARLRSPLVRVHVNQVGFDPAWPKTAVVETNFLPSEMTGELEIRTIGGEPVLHLPLSCAGRMHDGDADDWGSYFWRADFSTLSQPGRYVAVARFGDVDGKSYPFPVAPDVLLETTGALGVDFFFVQRCGFAVPGWHAACHMDDANLPDGAHIDATGGWHSAGDYNKLMYENGDGGVMFSMLMAYRSAPDYFARFHSRGSDLPDILDEAAWGAAFVAKMQIPENGGLRNNLQQGPGRTWMKWVAPEAGTDNIVGTADDPVINPGEGSSPLAIGGWARLSEILTAQGQPNDYLARAKRLWDHATAGGPGNSLLLLSALEMHAVTKEAAYLDYARQTAEILLAGQNASGVRRGAFGAYGETEAGALAAFALAHPEEPVSRRIPAALRDYLTFVLRSADNPFGLSKQSVGDPDYFFEPTSTLGHNFELLRHAWAAQLIYRLTGERRALVYAADQIDWVLGRNPIDLCMFEGAGSFNPPRYHHRYTAIPGRERGAVPGAIPNGFVRTIYALDSPGFDLSPVGAESAHASYRTSEPWLVHNMWYLMALSARPR
jgi:hypothetical protein